MEEQPGREQKLQLDKKQFERVEQFVLDLAPKLVRCAALYRYKYYAETRTFWKKTMERKEMERKGESLCCALENRQFRANNKSRNLSRYTCASFFSFYFITEYLSSPRASTVTFNVRNIVRCLPQIRIYPR